MAKIKAKLKDNSVKDFLVSDAGYVINKKEFNVVDDTDKDISYYFANRDDIMFSPVLETKEKDTKEKVMKSNDNNPNEATFKEDEIKKKSTSNKSSKKKSSSKSKDSTSEKIE